jgi:hypothetical protein
MTAEVRIGQKKKAAHWKTQCQRKYLPEICIQVPDIDLLGLLQHGWIDNQAAGAKIGLEEPCQSKENLDGP